MTTAAAEPMTVFDLPLLRPRPAPLDAIVLLNDLFQGMQRERDTVLTQMTGAMSSARSGIICAGWQRGVGSIPRLWDSRLPKLMRVTRFDGRFLHLLVASSDGDRGGYL